MQNYLVNKRWIIVIVIAYGITVFSQPPSRNAWKLTFSDEFEGPVLDVTRRYPGIYNSAQWGQKQER
jgi:hypothetical protein